MSRIYFHSEHGTAELRGSERAMMGTFCSTLLVAALGIDRAWVSDAKRFRKLLPADHYTQAGDDDAFLRSLKTWVCVGDGEFGVTTKTEPFTAALNTALRIGGDAVKLMARLHGQCEVHAYVEGPNRAWLANIMERGREWKIFRPRQGWETVIQLLRERDDCPVVTSYSVCQQFPNPSIAGWRDDREGDAFYELPHDERWSRALNGLRTSGGGLEMRPDTWTEFFFGDGVSGFTVWEELIASDGEN